MLFLVLFFFINHGVVIFSFLASYKKYNLDVELYFYDKDNKNGLKLDFSDGGSNIDLIPFKINSLTKIITHGITDNENSSSVAYGVKAYLERPYHVNIIAMSWKNYFPSLLSYARLKSSRDAHVQDASKLAFEKLNILVVKQKISLNRTHLLGHSLGAHFAGLIGTLFDGRISRITGFDPAGFMNDLSRYTSKSAVNEYKSTVLTKKCAKFVEAIHSEIGFSGTMETWAHSNIFISDGVSRQCDQFDLPYSKDLKCKHSVSFMTYYESIKFPFLFPMIKCNSYDEIVNHQCPNMKLIKSYLGDEKINPKLNTGLFVVHEVNIMKLYNLSYDSPLW